jgi:hypothetical protein
MLYKRFLQNDKNPNQNIMKNHFLICVGVLWIQCNIIAQTVCPPMSEPVLKTFLHQGWKYKIYKIGVDITVQRTKKKKCETIFEGQHGSGLECRDINGDKYLDLVMQDRKYTYIYMFDPSKVQYINTGTFGERIGYCDSKERVNDYFITCFYDKRDVFTYDLYKIVDFKQIIVGRIDFHVLKFDETDARGFVTGIQIFYKPKKPIEELDDEKPSKILAFDEIEPRFFKKGRFQKAVTYELIERFDQDAFVKYYFKKHFKKFVP